MKGLDSFSCTQLHSQTLKLCILSPPAFPCGECNIIYHSFNYSYFGYFSLLHSYFSRPLMSECSINSIIMDLIALLESFSSFVYSCILPLFLENDIPLTSTGYILPPRLGNNPYPTISINSIYSYNHSYNIFL